jgi:outer membrane lipoprotein LolB
VSRWRGAPAVLLALAGCASVAPPPGELLTGRLSVRVDDDASRSFNAAFELAGTAERGSLALSTPLGLQVAQADWSAQQVRLRSRDGERSYPDLDSLAADALGERLPLAALFDWLRGRPWAGAPYSASASGFAQLGWSVDLSRQAEGWVEAQRAAPPAVTVRAKLDLP